MQVPGLCWGGNGAGGLLVEQEEEFNTESTEEHSGAGRGRTHYSGCVEGTDWGSSWASGLWVERDEDFSTESAEKHKGQALQRMASLAWRCPACQCQPCPAGSKPAADRRNRLEAGCGLTA